MDFELDRPVRRATKVETQDSPHGMIPRVTNQADVRPNHSKEGVTPKTVSGLASYTHADRTSIGEGHKPCVEVQPESVTETVRSEPDSAAKAPVFVLIVPEANRALGVPAQRKAGMEYALHGHRASCLQLTALGPIPGRMPVAQGNRRCATNRRTPRQASAIVEAAHRGQRGRNPVASLDVESERVDAGFGLKLSGQHLGQGNRGAYGVSAKAYVGGGP